MPRGDGTGPQSGGGGAFKRGQGRQTGSGRMGLGLGGSCVCPKCGFKTAHVRGQPCVETPCPKCGTMMTRG